MKGKPRIRHLIWLCIALALGPGLASSQTPDAASKFRLASALEQAGDLEHAVQLYRELAAKDPANTLFSDALQRTLLQLKRYDEAIALINERLQHSPRDATLLTTLGTVYYRAGRERDAAATWDRVLALEPSNPNIYRIVASAQVENRLLDRAAETYRRGRAALGDRTQFTLELAQLLVATMDYAGATQEFLSWLDQNPLQVAFIQGRMTAFSAKPEAREAAIRVVQSALHRKENLRLYDLLGWLYMEGHDYASAYDAYAEVDRLSSAHGVSLLTFADRAAHDKAYDIAVRAYRAALSAPLPEGRRPAAMLGYAAVLMAAGTDSA
ncbi:MAG TPA: tetratricopeptide repeat protein, partial [Bacteroidota bacterium]